MSEVGKSKMVLITTDTKTGERVYTAYNTTYTEDQVLNNATIVANNGDRDIDTSEVEVYVLDNISRDGEKKGDQFISQISNKYPNSYHKTTPIAKSPEVYGALIDFRDGKIKADQIRWQTSTDIAKNTIAQQQQSRELPKLADNEIWDKGDIGKRNSDKNGNDGMWGPSGNGRTFNYP